MNTTRIGYGGMAPPTGGTATAPQPPPGLQSGLYFGVCQSLAEVKEAWGFTQARYRVEGIMTEERGSSLAVELDPGAAGAETAVVVGRMSGLVVTTATLMADEIGEKPLPIGRRFPLEMAEIRGAGARHVVEAGLFADRRSSDIDRTFGSVVELMRFAVHYARYLGATDVVCAVPAQRARLFARAFGFDAAGPVRPVRVFGGTEAVCMHGEIETLWRNPAGSRTLEYVLEGSIPADLFDGRFRFAGSGGDSEGPAGDSGGRLGKVAQSVMDLTDVSVARGIS